MPPLEGRSTAMIVSDPKVLTQRSQHSAGEQAWPTFSPRSETHQPSYSLKNVVPAGAEKSGSPGHSRAKQHATQSVSPAEGRPSL